MSRRLLARCSMGLLICGAGAAAACGGPDERAPGTIGDAPSSSLSGDGDGSPGGEGDGDGSAVGDGDGDPVGDGDGDTSGDGDGDQVSPEFNGPGAPVVDIDVGDDNIFNVSFPVSCSVAQSEDEMSRPYDADTVEIVLLDGDDEVVSEAPASQASDVFQGEFSVASLESGEYTARCIAGDTSSPVIYGMDETAVYIDNGPEIEVIRPSEDRFVSASSTVTFEFTATPMPLFDGDDEAVVEGPIVVLIDGEEFTATPHDEAGDTYLVQSVDLDDPAVFPGGGPNGNTLVTIRATNARGIEAEYTYAIVVDGTGPVVAVLSPPFGSIVGDDAAFRLQVTDELSGVDWETLTVELGSDDILPYNPDNPTMWSRDGDTVTLTIQTSDYGGLRDLSFNVNARDTVGNASTGAVSGNYRLDQYGPYLSLDPPNFRRLRDGVCSHAFDPVGDGNLNHGESTDQYAKLRGLVWDRANGEGSGSGVIHYSMVKEGSVKLWLSPGDAGQQLVIDATPDDDNTDCNYVDIDGTDAQFVQYMPVRPKGDAFFGDGTGDLASPDYDLWCPADSRGTATTAPDVLCNNPGNEDMYVVPAHSAEDGNIPIVYAPDVDESGLLCTGDTVEVPARLDNLYEGWVCAALEAEDNVGNRTVSAPLAFCLDNLEVGDEPPPCASAPETAPSCSDGCTQTPFPHSPVYDW